MLDRRATRIVWAFLIGVIAIEGWLTYASFKGHGDLLQTAAFGQAGIFINADVVHCAIARTL